MLERLLRKRPKAAWRIFNLGTKWEFAECTACEKTIDEYDKYDMPTRCPQCGADMVDLVFADDE